MMIAGLVRDDVRQAVNGLPGLSKLPVLGTLFRSRDFVRNETELVIIVTPYLARPVARNELAKPDDNFNAASDGAGMFLGRVNRVYGTMKTDKPQRPLPRRRRLHLQVSGDRGPCLTQRQDQQIAAPAAAGALAAAVAAPGAARSRCSPAAPKRDSITVGAVPDDYRTNHPIVIAEKEADARPAGRRRAIAASPGPAARSLEGFLADYDTQRRARC